MNDSSSPVHGRRSRFAAGAGAALLAASALAATPTAIAGEAPAASGIRHVVLCWLNEPGNPEHRRRVEQVSRELEVIPELQDLVIGAPVPSERPIVEDGFDVGLVMTFRDRAALAHYLDHPEHVRRVRETLNPLCARVQVIDIEY